MSDQHKTLEFGTDQEENSNFNDGVPVESQLTCWPSSAIFSLQEQCWSEILTEHVDIPSNNLPAGYINFPANSTHRENVEIIHDSFKDNNGKAPAPAQVESKKLFCFAYGQVDFYYLELPKRAYQVTIHRHNGFDSFSLTKVVDVSDLFQSLKVYMLSNVRLMFLIDGVNLLLTDELNLRVPGQQHLQMDVEFAFSLQNLMRSSICDAISKACSSRKTNSRNVRSFVVCECENELFLDQAADNRGKYSQSIQSFFPSGSNINVPPCRVASVVYSLYLNGEVHEDCKIQGRVSDITSSICFSSVNFSYRTQRHSSPGHSQDYLSHGTLSLSFSVPPEESDIGFFEIVYYPQRARLTTKGQRSPGQYKQKQYGSSPYLDYAVDQSSSSGRHMLLEEFEDDAIASHESQELIIDSQKNIQNEKKKSSTIWTAAGSISLQDIEKYYGKKKREEAAESLQVSVSTFKRLCRKYGIRRWPTAKRKKDGCLISARRCNGSIAELRTSQPPQNGVPREDRDTIFISMQKRKRREIEEDNVDANNHREEQPFEIQNCTSKRQALDCATKDSSCLKSINWTIEGVNKDQSPNSESINGNVMDGMDFTRIGVQPSLESTSIQQLNSISCKEQARRIVELNFDFPRLVQSWKEYSQSQVCNQRFFDDLEKNRTLLETSAKDEESLNIRYVELQRKEEELVAKKEELMAQLEKVQKEQVEIAEQRCEKFKQKKHLVSLVEEEAGRTRDKHLVMTVTSHKLNNLVDQWAAIQSSFMQIG